MSKYLVKIYPVYPHDKLEVYDLDILDEKFDTDNREWFQNFRTRIKELFESVTSYKRAYYRKVGDIYCFQFNNSNHYIVEASSLAEAVIRVHDEVGKEAK